MSGTVLDMVHRLLVTLGGGAVIIFIALMGKLKFKSNQLHILNSL